MTSAESVATPALSREEAPGGEWWRTAVIYQIYPRSFADQSGDGIGDLRGVTSHLGDLAALGVDAIWLSPFQRSPQKDAGYDVADYCDVDPIFGTLADFDEMLAQAHARGIRIIVDLVPNHSSDQHAWFQEAVASPAGSPERARYIFRDGKGENGEQPPNNWESVFGGGAWTRLTEPDGTPGQWYLHLFDASQPDFDWSNPEVREEFRRILRFWLDRGVDGFRVDVAHGLVKKEGLPDYTPPKDAGSMGGGEAAVPYWGQEGVHEIYRDWHALLAEYDGDRALCAEAWLPSIAQTALWVRPDEMHQAFNFEYLETPWDAEKLRLVIADSLAGYGAVGAPSTWVLSNHDVVRHASRLALTAENPQGAGIGPKSPGKPVPEVGLRRARAATTLMLALPGSAYLYQGEELGLPEVIDLPDEARQDPTWFRTNGERYGRDGCRVPLPWTSEGPAFGFNETGEAWLPQPAEWAGLARDAQRDDPGSTLTLYKNLLAERRARGLGAGTLEWVDGLGTDVVAFRNGSITVVANLGDTPIELPSGTVVVSSGPLTDRMLPVDQAVWLTGE
ncbi:MAG: alpha-amylase [Actinobacteria bacterium]|jgi:alpha-glucosidase|uniref:glycoside hydrolase family 13 protein n=1 Tax=unclassified Microbacterium TaxID=2609290 RepID=UPI000C4ADE14|nr:MULTISPECIES: alpha-amylase family glycosyl hydrolase [unclassified Microbacterium]RUA26818.1 MAG: alpha-amylase [Actinomycetota bacterium]MBU21125.1 alpha-amylase [Microbacterium sp.]HAM13776.1 alpha-amylase [Microbacterium sp.]HBS09540.1 alpha-amylase [Microbacterium sp.]HCU77330.1 alpha-amylase [Microbacterium sp.]|tara:strand:+ start:641 stop:2326 length:1686 start_codon:yes stop_codon:yes gene_type:complete